MIMWQFSATKPPARWTRRSIRGSSFAGSPDASIRASRPRTKQRNRAVSRCAARQVSRNPVCSVPPPSPRRTRPPPGPAAPAFGVAATPNAGAAGPGGGRVRLGEGGGTEQTGFLDTCLAAQRDTARFRCFVRGLLARIEASGDPANELPRIDRRVHRAGGFVAENCHMIMHVVGRTFARRHHLTLVTLQRYVPRSNDPTCSGGFGMGLVLYLGPRIAQLGPEGAAQACLGLPTRFRR